MSLLSIDITKPRKLSFSPLELPSKEMEAKPTPEPVVAKREDKPPSPSKPIAPHPVEPKAIDKDKLKAIAERVVEIQNHYSQEEIISRIIEIIEVNRERAEIGFKLLLEAKLLEPILEDRYYLSSSTPF